MNKINILLRNNYISLPEGNSNLSEIFLATILVNLSYYGYGLNVDCYNYLSKLTDIQAAEWWSEVEPELKLITGDSRNISNFVVYKNFPKEVLSKSEAEYWIPQFLMYWGFPNELFTQPIQPRTAMSEKTKAVILQRANSNTLVKILDSLLKKPSSWTDSDFKDVVFLSEFCKLNSANICFKENLIKLATYAINSNLQLNIDTATDVLRLAVGLSNGDISLKTNTKFISFKKPQRKYLLNLLEKSSNLSEDFARRPQVWKKLIHQLHPGDYKKSYPKVCHNMNLLYNDKLKSFNSEVEILLLNRDPNVLTLLSKRPGEFRRRLVHTLDLFGNDAVRAFANSKVLNNLTTHQLVSLYAFLKSSESRWNRIFPPKGNWAKAKVAPNRKVKKEHVHSLCKVLELEIAKRTPKIKKLDKSTEMVKLPTNSSEVSQYNRGTVFTIPENIKFIRTASYWQSQYTSNVWFDNGWNFFDDKWNSLGACCWTSVNIYQGSAIFSGDPTSSKEMQGRAAQLIDLYPEKLLRAGVRYGIWNVLCYSRIPFSECNDVFAALQWGEDAQKGKLFEPSRCQLSFPLTSKHYTKYVCLIDFKENKMIYLDANLAADAYSAANNGEKLSNIMPAYLEYLNSLPSVYDLFKKSVSVDGKGYVLYSDKNTPIKDEDSYVFNPENKNNKFEKLDLNKILT